MVNSLLDVAGVVGLYTLLTVILYRPLRLLGSETVVGEDVADTERKAALAFVLASMSVISYGLKLAVEPFTEKGTDTEPPWQTSATTLPVAMDAFDRIVNGLLALPITLVFNPLVTTRTLYVPGARSAGNVAVM
jgi:hypothetical protein